MRIIHSIGVGRFMSNVMRISGTLSTEKIKKVEPVETNIVIFEIDSIINSDLFINKLNEKGIKIISMGDNKLRIVTHLDYTEEMHQAFLKILNELKF